MFLGPPGALNIKGNPNDSIVYGLQTGHLVVTEFLGSAGKYFVTNVYHLMGDQRPPPEDQASNSTSQNS